MLKMKRNTRWLAALAAAPLALGIGAGVGAEALANDRGQHNAHRQVAHGWERGGDRRLHLQLVHHRKDGKKKKFRTDNRRLNKAIRKARRDGVVTDREARRIERRAEKLYLRGKLSKRDARRVDRWEDRIDRRVDRGKRDRIEDRIDRRTRLGERHYRERVWIPGRWVGGIYFRGEWTPRRWKEGHYLYVER